MAELFITTLSKEKQITLMSERIQALFSLKPEDADHYSEKLYNHYSQTQSMPRTAATLDASIRVLLKIWGLSEKGKIG